MWKASWPNCGSASPPFRGSRSIRAIMKLLSLLLQNYGNPDEVAEHMARAREAVQQQMGRRGRSGRPIEDLQTVHVGGAIVDSSHPTSPSESVQNRQSLRRQSL